MIYICDFCGKRASSKFRLRVAKEDAFGFALLCVALVGPVGFIAFLISLIAAGDEIVFGISVFVILMCVYFFRIGRKVYGFFSLFVDYDLHWKFFCKRCQRDIKDIHLPERPKDV